MAAFHYPQSATAEAPLDQLAQRAIPLAAGLLAKRQHNRSAHSAKIARMMEDPLALHSRARAKTHSTPPCGTWTVRPKALSSNSCLRWASTPQPDCTAIYWTPSIA